MTTSQVTRSELFRTPSPVEKELGLWVDRIGSSHASDGPRVPRLLGLHGVVYTDQGSGVFDDGSGIRRAGAGSCLHLFPERPHVYYPENGPWRTFWIVFTGPLAARLLGLKFLPAEQSLQSDPGRIVLRTHGQLAGIMDKHEPASCLARFAVITRMIHDLHAQALRLSTASDSGNLVTSVCSYLETNYHRPISPATLASHFGVSYTHLRRLFRDRMGQSMKEYMTALRISHAKALLREKQWPLKRVAAEVGYRSQFYFMRVFRDVVGVPPGKFQ